MITELICGKYGKKGATELETIVAIIIVLVLLFAAAILYYLLSGQGGELLDKLLNLF